MKMQKGLCIELNGSSSVFIGQNGEFVHGTPAGKMNVGEEGFFYPKQVIAKRKRKSFKPVWAPIIAALAVAVLFLSVLIPKQEAFTYVQVQVNPGVELGIDEEYEVVSIRELNADGREIIRELGEWKNHSLEEVLDRVITLSMQETTENIVITTVADEVDEIADKTVVDSVLAISAKTLAKNVTVQLKEASKKQWRNSVEKSVPVGQLIRKSTNFVNDKKEEKTINAVYEDPLKVKEKPNRDKVMDKELKKTENTEKKESKDKAKEERNLEKDEVKDKKNPSLKQKEVPNGQEKKKDTPAVKGNSKPLGQEKRSEVPTQTPKTEEAKTDRSSVIKEKAPSQKKEKDLKSEHKEKTDSSKTKDNLTRSKPVNSEKQNSNEKNSAKEKETKVKETKVKETKVKETKAKETKVKNNKNITKTEKKEK